MTIAQMHQLFKIMTNKVDSLNYPNLEPEEIDSLLNNESDKIIEQRAYGNNSKRTGVEETQKRVDDLRNITNNWAVPQVNMFTTLDNKPNGIFTPLPTDYRHALSESASILYTNCHGSSAKKAVRVDPITDDRYNTIILDPFNKPYQDLIVRLPFQIVNSQEVFELITDGTYTILQYNLRYLRTPVRMQYGTTYSTPTTDVNCELAEHLHREIVEATAYQYLENIESPRFNTQQAIIKGTE